MQQLLPSVVSVVQHHVSTYLLTHLSAHLYIITTTLIIHHSVTLSLQAQNLRFRQILLTFFYPGLPSRLRDWTGLIMMGLDRTYHDGTGPDLS